MLISVHLPKTAGTSFAKSLEGHFGDALFKEYIDLPLHQSTLKRNTYATTKSILNSYKQFNDIKCIHGHFLPLKYRFCKATNNIKYITWIRDPTERLASQYFYMKRNYSPEKATNQPLLKKMFDEDWTLERFCLGNEFRNTYSKYLWGFPLKNFDFIGIVENYENELSYFSDHILNATISNHIENKNPNPPAGSYYTDTHLKNKVIKHHRKDVLLYKQAVKLMNTRYNSK